jgi:signal transduction histidine kinase/CheY-like chemotaxis protein
MLNSGDTSLLTTIHQKEVELNRNIILLTQLFRDISPIGDLVTYRESIQEKVDFEQALISTFRGKGRAEAWEMMNSPRVVDLQKNYNLRSQKLLATVKNRVDTQTEQLKKDRVDIISLDYAIPHLTSFIFLLIAGFTIFKIFQVSQLNNNLNVAISSEKKAHDVKDQFMDTMTHELRSPLNSVLGYTNLLLKTKLDTDQHKYVKSIRTSGELLLNVINEVLDYSKIKSGYIRIASSPFRFREQMDALSDIVLDKITEKNINFHCEVDDIIPDNLRGDSVKLLQVLLNLTYNAIKFTNGGNITVRATCKERTSSSVVIDISVEDTGIGIPADKLPYIFERFYQVEGTLGKVAGGTGLGLSITKEMLALQGGSIHVESEVGKGSTFYVVIPYDIDASAADPDSDSAAAVIAGSGKRLPASMKVLVVDDNLLNREMISYMLKNFGVTFKLANNGPEAIRALQTEKYDVVLMDLQMAGMDGKETTARIRKDLGSDVPIVAFSAYAEVAEKQKSLAAGMDAYISKPVKEEELFETLEFFTPHVEESTSFDLEYLRKVSSGNAEFVESVAMRIADALPREIAELKEALIHNDQHTVNTMAHDMKTTFAVLGIYGQLEKPLNYLESWQSSPKTMPVAGEMIHMIEDLGLEVTQQLLEAFAKPGAD